MNTENKLTFEFLSPYLPYQVKFYNEKSGKINTLEGLAMDNDGINLYFHGVLKSFTLNNWPLKPILRPMSDFKNFRNKNGSGIYEITFNVANLDIDEDADINVEEIGSNYLSLISCYRTLQQLLKYHFDVFGLIKSGLAIDINTIEQK